MKKIKLKIPAKVNLTLDVLGANEGYHELSSLVASINIFDKITIKERTDKIITLENKGIAVDCSVTDNNAYKAGKLFMETFGTNGVDIKIDKAIPLSSGLGGSSADIAGVIKGMAEIYEVNGDLKELASKLGSDVAYMMDGGYAVIQGRGNKIFKKDIDKKLYLTIITDKQGVSSRATYKKYDEIGKSSAPCTEKAVKALADGDYLTFGKVVKNDLYPASVTFNENIKKNLETLIDHGAEIALMTGSGSAVYAISPVKKRTDDIYKKLKDEYNDKILKCEILI